MSEKNEDLDDLIALVDESIMSELTRDETGLLLGVYDFFDSLNKPLDPREFLEFWASLSFDDRVYYLNPSSRKESSSKTTRREWDTFYAISRTFFKETGDNWWENEEVSA
jgi:hypothetical protein